MTGHDGMDSRNFYIGHVFKPAAPEPQAEGTSDLRGTCDNKHPSSTYPHRQAVDCVNWRAGAAPAETAQTDAGWGCDSPFHLRDDGGETAGEMTAEQFWPAWKPTRLGSPNEMSVPRSVVFQFAEAFAKQRVEQAERQRDTWKDCAEKTGAKVADLERERDTRPFVADKMTDEQLEAVGMTRAAHKRVQKSFDVLFDCSEGWQKRAESAESELREMREAAEKLANKLRRIFDSEEYKGIFTIAHIHGCKYDGENCGEELAAAERLLARKAGS